MKDHKVILTIIFFLVILIFVILIFVFQRVENKRVSIQEQHSKQVEQLTQRNQELTKELNRQKHIALLIYNHADPKSMKKDTTLTRIMLTGDNQ